jgi:hypothetical protein
MTTPAETLRRAVTAMRAHAAIFGDVPESFFPAVADWLEAEAEKAAQMDGYEDSAVYPLMLSGCRLPLAVARAFLGEQEGEAP